MLKQYGLGKDSGTVANRDVGVRAYMDVLAACPRNFTQPMMRGLAQTLLAVGKVLLLKQTVQMITQAMGECQ